MVGGGIDVTGGRFVSQVLDNKHHSNSYSLKLLSLNLCKNKLCQLNGLSDIIQIAPTIKILNLSKNEVRRGSQVKVGLRMGGGYQSHDRRDAKVPVGERGVVGAGAQMYLFS